MWEGGGFLKGSAPPPPPLTPSPGTGHTCIRYNGMERGLRVAMVMWSLSHDWGDAGGGGDMHGCSGHLVVKVTSTLMKVWRFGSDMVPKLQPLKSYYNCFQIKYF